MNKKILWLAIIPLVLSLSACGGEKIKSTTTPESKVSQPAEVKIDPTTPYTPEEVATHNNEGDCWSSINGNVYNLTRWINEHPGGPSPILQLCGHDGSTMFNMQHGMMEYPNQVIKLFIVGVLKSDKVTK